MEAYATANELFAQEDYEGALSSYTLALTEQPQGDAAAAAAVYLGRAGCYERLRRGWTSAVQDCNKALSLLNGEDGATARLRQLSLYRKGVACFELEEFESAKEAFEAGLALLGTTDAAAAAARLRVDRDLRKCNVELADAAKQQTAAAASAPTAAAAAAPVAASKPAAANPPVAPALGGSAPLPLPATRYQYYQTEQAVVVSVLVKNMEPDKVSVSITPDTLRVALDHGLGSGNKPEVVIDKELFATIDAERSKFEVRKTKVEITLAKTERYEWHSLENTGKPRVSAEAKAAAAAAAASAAAASSSAAGADTGAATKDAAAAAAAPLRPRAYASPKDWDSVGAAIERELEETEKPEGEEALQKLFRDIYAKADPETRRAMNKSFQTSGGTVLSTNWKEVSDKDYEKERQAPKGMEWKDWEGKKLPQIED